MRGGPHDGGLVESKRGVRAPGLGSLLTQLDRASSEREVLFDRHAGPDRDHLLGRLIADERRPESDAPWRKRRERISTPAISQRVEDGADCHHLRVGERAPGSVRHLAFDPSGA